MVTPMLSPLVHASGATWFPSAFFDKPSLLIAPEQVETINIKLAIPGGIPEGSFRGMLLLQGFRDNAIPVTIDVTNLAPESRSEVKPAGKSAVKKKAQAKKP